MREDRFRSKWAPFRQRTEIEVDSQHFKLFKRKSFSFFKIKFRVGKMVQVASIPINRIIFWGNNENAERAKWLYISKDAKHKHLPQPDDDEVFENGEDDWSYADISKIENKKIIDEPAEDLDADLYLYAPTTRIRLSHSTLIKLYNDLQSYGSIKASVKKSSGIFFKHYIAYTTKWLFHIHGKKIDSTPIKEMAFFVKNKKNLYCGYHRQINAKINNCKLFTEIRDLCFSTSKRLNSSGQTFIIGLFRPDCITLTDSAIVYTRKTFKRYEMAYVPYSRISMLFESAEGFFKKRISIFGEQNIIPKHSLRRNIAKQIISTLTEHGVNNAKGGKIFSSSRIIPGNWFGNASRIVCMNDCIVYFPSRIKNNIHGSFTLRYPNISSVTWYKKIFRLFGTCEVVSGDANIRTDQNAVMMTMVVPSLWIFRYRKLRKLLKERTSADFKRKWKEYDG